MSVRRKIVLSVVALATLVGAGPAAGYAVCPGFPVKVLKTGPKPAKVTLRAGDAINWIVPGPSSDNQITFAGDPCSLSIGGISAGGFAVSGCSFFVPGTYSYTVRGFGEGTGTVVVLPPQLIALDATVVYGHTVAIVGELPIYPECFGGGGLPTRPPPPPVQRVGTIFEQSYGEASPSPLTDVTAIGARGAFALLAAPVFNTVYQARLGDLSSETATVDVRPRIDVARMGSAFSVHVEEAHALAQARVGIQVRRRGSRWATVRTLELDATGSARFLAQRRGGQLRIFMSARQAGPGYVAGFSRALSL
jgi:hypothetical protein